MMPFGNMWNSFNLINIISDEEIAEQLPRWTISDKDIPNLNPSKIDELIEIGLMTYLDVDRGSNSWVVSG